MLDFESFDVVTFDCYGTLIDWESGILGALRPLLNAHGVTADDERILELYAAFESQAENGAFRDYKHVLSEVVRSFAKEFRFAVQGDEETCLERSFANWRPFGDTVEALTALESRYSLVILSNVDDDLFEHSAAQLGVHFDNVITAHRLGAYKPSRRFFDAALAELCAPRKRILHVAQSLYHDVIPAQELGLATAWVHRRHGREGSGATPAAQAWPDLVVPDLRSLAVRMNLLTPAP